MSRTILALNALVLSSTCTERPAIPQVAGGKPEPWRVDPGLSKGNGLLHLIFRDPLLFLL